MVPRTKALSKARSSVSAMLILQAATCLLVSHAQPVDEYVALSPITSYHYCAPANGPVANPAVVSATVSYRFCDSPDELSALLNAVSPTVSYRYYDSPDAPILEPSAVSPIVSYAYLQWPEEVVTPSPVTSPAVSFYSGDDFGALLSVTPLARSVPASGGTVAFEISNSGSGVLHWHAAVASGGEWLSIVSPAAGDGAGALSVLAQANASSSPRSGNVEITADQTIVVEVHQAGVSEPEDAWDGSARFAVFAEGQPEAPVVGACTDGESIVTLVLSHLPNDLQANEIAVTTAPAVGTLLTLTLDSGTHTAYQNYRVPGVYPGGANATSPLRFRISVGDVIVEKELLLARPPVAMLHGWGGKPDKWNTMKSALGREGFKFTYAHNYHATSNKRFVVNRDEAFLAVSYAKRQALRERFLATKVDVVAHSMGGIIARYYAQEFATVPYQENIRRFITIGTPHSGSEFANIAVILRDMPLGVGRGFSSVARAAGLVVDEGAVDDLAVDSAAIEDRLNAVNLGKYSVASHAVIGTSYLPEIPGWAGAVWKFASFIVSDLAVDTVLGSPNDFVVGHASQSGGLPPFSTTEINVSWHVAENTEPAVIDYVIFLLDGSTAADFASQGFVAPVDLNFIFDWDPFKAAIENSHQNLKTGSITVTSPADGATYVSGSSVEVRAAASTDATSLLVFTPFEAKEVQGSTCACTVLIPDDFLGELPIMVLARNSQGLLDSKVLRLWVNPPAAVVDLYVLPEGTITVACGSEIGLQVIGEFADGIVRDVTSQAIGTEYLSGAPQILGVTQDGKVKGLEEGIGSVTVTNGVSKTVDVEVIQASQGKAEDVNHSGRIDAVDIQLVINEALGLSTQFECDIDANGSINAIDIQLVINAALGLL